MPKKTIERTKGQSLEETLKEIRSRFGDDSIMTLNQKPNSDVEALSTGSIGLDYASGIGGLPRGRIVEIFGKESSGKTTLALHVVAEAQKKGGICAYVDSEHALDPQYAQRLGVQTKDLLISQPDGGEQALQIVDSLVSGSKVAVVVVDSVASLVPKSEVEGQIGDLQIGAQARLMSQAMRMLTGSIARSNTLVIFVNQVRSDIQSLGWGGPKEVTSGGRALKFYASMRIEVKKIASIKRGDEIVGSRIKAIVAKNKVAAPFKQTEFDIVFNEGISKASELLILGEKYGLISKSGATFRYGNETLGRGYETARNYLKDTPEVSVRLTEEIKKHQSNDQS